MERWVSNFFEYLAADPKRLVIGVLLATAALLYYWREQAQGDFTEACLLIDELRGGYPEMGTPLSELTLEQLQLRQDRMRADVERRGELMSEDSVAAREYRWSFFVNRDIDDLCNLLYIVPVPAPSPGMANE